MVEITDGIGAIADERIRQQREEGYTPEFDDQYTDGELIDSAVCYALYGRAIAKGMTKEQARTMAGIGWPETWSPTAFKPDGGMRDLVRAGALIAAEIDRRIRAGEME